MKKNNDKLIDQLLKFRKERDWEQFHTPKNLAIAISVEAAELLSIFQWIKDDEIEMRVKDKIDEIKGEIADIYIYLSYLANDLQIDLEENAKKKLKVNAKRYPVSKAKGNAKKYTELK
jgi:NTP pyrophosphatase (non-canonical NTP hydrolase)